MARGRLQSTVLFVTVFGAMLFLPPLVLLPGNLGRLFGLPYQVIYLFLVWLALVIAAFWFGRRLPQDSAGQAENPP